MGHLLWADFGMAPPNPYCPHTVRILSHTVRILSHTVRATYFSDLAAAAAMYMIRF